MTIHKEYAYLKNEILAHTSQVVTSKKKIKELKADQRKLLYAIFNPSFEQKITQEQVNKLKSLNRFLEALDQENPCLNRMTSLVKKVGRSYDNWNNGRLSSKKLINFLNDQLIKPEFQQKQAQVLEKTESESEPLEIIGNLRFLPKDVLRIIFNIIVGYSKEGVMGNPNAFKKSIEAFFSKDSVFMILANLINNKKIFLNTLNLSVEDLQSLMPHLKRVNLPASGFLNYEKLVFSLLDKMMKVEHLHLAATIPYSMINCLINIPNPALLKEFTMAGQAADPGYIFNSEYQKGYSIIDMNFLSVFKNLEKIDVSNNFMTDLEGITLFNRLTELNISGCDQGRNLRYLETLHDLTSLYLNETHIKEGQLEPLNSLPHLKRLFLAGSGPYLSIKQIIKCSELIELDLSQSLEFSRRTRFDDEELKDLNQLSKLERLTLKGCGAITGDFFKSLENLKSSLKYLSLKNCKLISTGVLSYLKEYKSLQYINLKGCALLKKQHILKFMTANPKLKIDYDQD